MTKFQSMLLKFACFCLPVQNMYILTTNNTGVMETQVRASCLIYCGWFSKGGIERLKRVVEDMTHSQCRHAFIVQLVNVNAHVQQEMDHIIVALNLSG